MEYLNTTSNFTDIKTGVPQGSIIGPLLFIIYINDFPSASTIFSLIMYADDTTLCSTLNAFKPKSQNETFNGNINKELCKIDKWLKLNKLSLNTTKSKFIIFHMPQNKVEIPLININNVNIECVANFDFLGVTTDKKLSWKGHTDKISLKLSRCVGILNKLKLFLPQHILLAIYNSMFLPHINYCIIAWGYNYQRIFKIQRKVVIVISLNKYKAHTDPLFKHLKLLKMKDIHQIQQLKFYHKLINNQTPNTLLHWVSFLIFKVMNIITGSNHWGGVKCFAVVSSERCAALSANTILSPQRSNHSTQLNVIIPKKA